MSLLEVLQLLVEPRVLVSDMTEAVLVAVMTRVVHRGDRGEMEVVVVVAAQR